MIKEAYPYYLANEAVWANTDLVVTDKYSGELATRVALADAETIDRAIAATVEASRPMRRCGTSRSAQRSTSAGPYTDRRRRR